MKFNINDYVRVKLTDLGRAVHREDHDKFWEGHKKLFEYTPPKEDEEGWSEWQLWDLMESFGPHMGMTRDLVFETEICLNPSMNS